MCSTVTDIVTNASFWKLVKTEISYWEKRAKWQINFFKQKQQIYKNKNE